MYFQETWGHVIGSSVMVAGARFVEVAYESDHKQKKFVKLFLVAMMTACGVYVTTGKTIAACIIGGIVTFGGGNLVELIIENFV